MNTEAFDTLFFEIESSSMSDLRQPGAMLERLRQKPLKALRLERYANTEAVIITPQTWALLMDVARGAARLFIVRVDMGEGGYDKRVIARELDAQEGSQRWEVFVDGVAYTMGASAETREIADFEQVIWRHHSDVASQVLERFSA